MADLLEVLESLAAEASADLDSRSVTREDSAAWIESVCGCVGNRAGVRLVMACMLAKVDKPEIDPREPYVEIVLS